MIKKISLLLIGILIGSFSFGMVSVLADQSIQLIVNGKVINSDVPPQIINGRTMVPARFLAEALGATVSWDASTNAVIITSQDQHASVNYPPPYFTKDQQTSKNTSNVGIDLMSLDYAGTDSIEKLSLNKWNNSNVNYTVNNKNFMLAGKTYNKGIGFASGSSKSAYIAYNLNSAYTRLTGYFGTEDAARYYSDVFPSNKITIYGDDKIIYESPFSPSGNVPIFVDIDIKGINQLKIQFEGGPIYNKGKIEYEMFIYVRNPVFADPQLYQ